MVYCGILWYTVVYCDILWYTVVYCGSVLGYTVVYYHTSVSHWLLVLPLADDTVGSFHDSLCLSTHELQDLASLHQSNGKSALVLGEHLGGMWRL